MEFLEKIKAVWENVSLVQRALLLAIFFTVVIGGGLLTYWAGQPEMRLLYQDLSPEEASKITEKLNERGISYELKSSGTAVYAPREQIYQLRLDMAKEGLPAGEHTGFKIFDDQKIGVSPFVQNVNLQRAIQEELSKSIQMIDGVEHARVHIVSPEKKLFSSQEDKTTASVVLKIQPGYRLSSSTIAAVTHLVAGSVEKLKSDGVTVIDSQGRLLSFESDQSIAKGADTVQDYKERVEQNLSAKVEDMLTTVLGPGRASVRVNADVNMTSGSRTIEKYDPAGRVVTKEEIKTNSETEPAESTGKNDEVLPAGEKKDEEILTEYAVGRTLEEKVELAGEVEHLSVAAFVDLYPADSNSEEADSAQPLMEISEVEDAISKALGLKDSDSLKVVNTRFHRNVEPAIQQEQPKWMQYLPFVRQGSLGLMAVCALIVLKIFSGGRKKAAKQTAGRAEVAGQQESTGMLPGSSSESNEPAAMRKQIAAALRQNPDQVKQLFNAWIEQRG